MEKNIRFRAYPVRKEEVDKGYSTVPMDADRQHFRPSVADVRLGQCSRWEAEWGEYFEPLASDD